MIDNSTLTQIGYIVLFISGYIVIKDVTKNIAKLENRKVMYREQIIENKEKEITNTSSIENKVKRRIKKR